MTDTHKTHSPHDCNAFRKRCRTNEIKANERANRYKVAALTAYEVTFEGWTDDEKPTFEEWVTFQVEAE